MLTKKNTLIDNLCLLQVDRPSTNKIIAVTCICSIRRVRQYVIQCIKNCHQNFDGIWADLHHAASVRMLGITYFLGFPKFGLQCARHGLLSQRSFFLLHWWDSGKTLISQISLVPLLGWRTCRAHFGCARITTLFPWIYPQCLCSKHVDCTALFVAFCNAVIWCSEICDAQFLPIYDAQVERFYNNMNGENSRIFMLLLVDYDVHGQCCNRLLVHNVILRHIH